MPETQPIEAVDETVTVLPAVTVTDEQLLTEAETKTSTLLNAITVFNEQAPKNLLIASPTTEQVDVVAHGIRQRLETVLKLQGLAQAEAYLLSGLKDPTSWGTLLGWAVVSELGKVADAKNYQQQSRAWLDEWLFGHRLAATLQELGSNPAEADYAVQYRQSPHHLQRLTARRRSSLSDKTHGLFSPAAMVSAS